jgi:hypothetical protein
LIFYTLFNLKQALQEVFSKKLQKLGGKAQEIAFIYYRTICEHEVIDNGNS